MCTAISSGIVPALAGWNQSSEPGVGAAESGGGLGREALARLLSLQAECFAQPSREQGSNPDEDEHEQWRI